MLIRTALFASFIATSVCAGDLGCKGNPHLIGACYTVNGELLMSADIGYVFGPDGSRDAKVVRAAPQSNFDMPRSMSDVMGADALFTHIKGEFVVCPIPEQTSQFTHHEVQYICIDSASSVHVESTRKSFPASRR